MIPPSGVPSFLSLVSLLNLSGNFPFLSNDIGRFLGAVIPVSGAAIPVLGAAFPVHGAALPPVGGDLGIDWISRNSWR